MLESEQDLITIWKSSPIVTSKLNSVYSVSILKKK